MGVDLAALGVTESEPTLRVAGIDPGLEGFVEGSTVTLFPGGEGPAHSFTVVGVASNNLTLSEAVPRGPSLLARRVTVPEFELASSPMIRLSDVRERRFPMLGDPISNLRGVERLNTPANSKITAILTALVQSQQASPPPLARSPGSLGSVWEALESDWL